MVRIVPTGQPRKERENDFRISYMPSGHGRENYVCKSINGAAIRLVFIVCSGYTSYLSIYILLLIFFIYLVVFYIFIDIYVYLCMLDTNIKLTSVDFDFEVG